MKQPPKSDITWSDVSEGLRTLWKHYWLLKEIDLKRAESFRLVIIETTRKIKRD